MGQPQHSNLFADYNKIPLERKKKDIHFWTSGVYLLEYVIGIGLNSGRYVQNKEERNLGHKDNS